VPDRGGSEAGSVESVFSSVEASQVLVVCSTDFCVASVLARCDVLFASLSILIRAAASGGIESARVTVRPP
jgi:hypothetical protein